MTTLYIRHNLDEQEKNLFKTLLTYTLGQLDSEIKKDSECYRMELDRRLIFDILLKIDKTDFGLDDSEHIFVEKTIIPMCNATSKSEKQKKINIKKYPPALRWLAEPEEEIKPNAKGIEFILSRFKNEVVTSLGKKLKDTSNYMVTSTNTFFQKIQVEQKENIALKYLMYGKEAFEGHKKKEET